MVIITATKGGAPMMLRIYIRLAPNKGQEFDVKINGVKLVQLVSMTDWLCQEEVPECCGSRICLFDVHEHASEAGEACELTINIEEIPAAVKGPVIEGFLLLIGRLHDRQIIDEHTLRELRFVITQPNLLTFQ